MDFSGWELDLRALYGRRWKARERLHLTERLYESPDGARAVLLFGIGEVGMNKQIGWLALFHGKPDPRLLYHSGRTRFWFEGQAGEAVEFSADGCRADVFEFTQSLWRPHELGCRRRVLDCDRGRLFRV